MRRILGAVAIFALALAACGGNGTEGGPSTTEDQGGSSTTEDQGLSPEEALLANYAATLNSGDIDAAMQFFYEPSIVKRHFGEPPGGHLDGPSEIRTIESLVPSLQGSGTGVEFLEIEVYEGESEFVPDVNFDWRFFYGADGAGQFWGVNGIESGGEAGCVGGKNGSAIITDGKFHRLDWGFEDATKCSN